MTTRIQRLFALLVAATAVTLSLGPASTAQAASSSISLAAVEGSIDAGTRPQFRFKVTHMPHGGRVLLQRRVGARKVWTTVTSTASSSGTFKRAPSLTLGRYSYRGVVRTRDGASVAVSRTVTISVFGDVSLAELCAHNNDNTSNWDSAVCRSGTVQVGSTVFSYDVMGYAYYPDYNSLWKNSHSSCRSISVRFAANGDDGDPTVYAKVVQGTRDPSSASVTAGNIGTLSATITPGDSFYLQVSAASTPYYENTGTYLDGSASCFSTSGIY